MQQLQNYKRQVCRLNSPIMHILAPSSLFKIYIYYDIKFTSMILWTFKSNKVSFSPFQTTKLFDKLLHI